MLYEIRKQNKFVNDLSSNADLGGGPKQMFFAWKKFK